MTRCTHCNTVILVGGVEQEGRRFCSEKCRTNSGLAQAVQQLSPEVVARAVAETAAGNCPVCAGTGPVDVFTSHRVYSALYLTSWRSQPRISCRGCATKAQLGDLVFSLFLGWWGIPWGFVMTPVQIFRNLNGLRQDPDPTRSAPQFESLVRMRLAREASAQPVRRAA